MKKTPDLRREWLSVLREQFASDYMQDLGDFLRSEKAAGKEIYPPGAEFFAAPQATPPKEVKSSFWARTRITDQGRRMDSVFRYGVANDTALLTEHIQGACR